MEVEHQGSQGLTNTISIWSVPESHVCLKEDTIEVQQGSNKGRTILN